MQVSNHANERINERCGLNKKSAERLSKLALENGISHHDTVGSLNRYLTKLFFYNRQANNIKIYGEYISCETYFLICRSNLHNMNAIVPTLFCM